MQGLPAEERLHCNKKTVKFNESVVFHSVTSDHHHPSHSYSCPQILKKPTSSRRVFFSERVSVILIPQRREYFAQHLEELLWYPSKELQNQLESACTEIQLYIKDQTKVLLTKKNEVLHPDLRKESAVQEMFTSASNKVSSDGTKISSETSIASYCYKVRFKRQLQSFEVESDDGDIMILKVGSFVQVQSDRGGKDIGIIHSKEANREVGAEGYRSKRMELEYSKQRILRAANKPDEVAEYCRKEQDEKHVQCKVENMVSAMGLPMTVLDAEYQFDRRKLTVFYRAVNAAMDEEKDGDDLLPEHVTNLSNKIMALTKTRVFMKKVDDGESLLQPINPTAALLLSAEKDQKGFSESVEMGVRLLPVS